MYEGPYVIDDPHTPRFRVHRSAMVDPDILEQERAKVFDRSWLYVDHESDIAKPHEFRTRSVGGRPIIFVRSTDGAIGVFVNSCPHAGMQIETRPEGQGRFLKCFYHGWTFNTAGALVALPDEESYGPNFDRETSAWSDRPACRRITASCSSAGRTTSRTSRPTSPAPPTSWTASPINPRSGCA